MEGEARQGLRVQPGRRPTVESRERGAHGAEVLNAIIETRGDTRDLEGQGGTESSQDRGGDGRLGWSWREP